MKVLMMVLIVGLVGCEDTDINDYVNSGNSVNTNKTEVVEPIKCADYREVVELNQTTYQVYNNTCNTITNIVFNSRGELSKVTKVVDTFWSGENFITITYNAIGFTYEDSTISKATRNSAGTQRIDYKYVYGDNFIEKDLRPSRRVLYTYEGEPEFNKIMDDVGYDQVIIKVRDVISAP